MAFILSFQMRELSCLDIYPCHSHLDVWGHPSSSNWSQAGWWAVMPVGGQSGEEEGTRAHTAVPLPVCLGLCPHVCPSWASPLQERPWQLCN